MQNESSAASSSGREVSGEGPMISRPDSPAATERLRAALSDVLDAAERAMAGFPIESEEWYARRDFARIVLEDTEEVESRV